MVPTHRASTTRAVFLLVLAAGLLVTGGCGGKDTGNRPEFPEELWSYPVSHIFIARREDRPAKTFKDAEGVMEEIWSGREFAEVARSRSEDPESAEIGGFLGFFRPKQADPMAGAIQVLTPGEIQGPLITERGAHIFKRHTFEEGRRLEAELTVPALGLFLPWKGSAEGEDRTREAARELAEELVARIQGGELDIAEATRQYGSERQKRSGPSLGLIRRAGSGKGLYEALRAVESGQFIPVQEYPAGFAVMMRGPYYRSLLRHVLITHRDNPGRPLTVRRSREEALLRAKEALDRAAKDGSNWSEIVKSYHEEPGGAYLDGSLGAMAAGTLHGAIDAVVLETTPGRVADRIAETPAGFHVIYRVK